MTPPLRSLYHPQPPWRVRPATSTSPQQSTCFMHAPSPHTRGSWLQPQRNITLVPRPEQPRCPSILANHVAVHADLNGLRDITPDCVIWDFEPQDLNTGDSYYDLLDWLGIDLTLQTTCGISSPNEFRDAYTDWAIRLRVCTALVCPCQTFSGAGPARIAWTKPVCVQASTGAKHYCVR